VFLRVIRALPQFELREAKVSTWIFQIAVRLIQDFRRRPTRVLVPVADTLTDGADSPEQSCARRRSLQRIEVLVQRLPADQRMALVLIEFHGLSYTEVADVLQCDSGTVKSRVHRARAFLRAALAHEERDER
jgi:RNA polymerase sigma-70 factor (ECF subfamily)